MAPAKTDARPRAWRLRDLEPNARRLAVGVALALFLIPMLAAVYNSSRWYPQGDDALIELRAREVGTTWTPLVGQPSTSGLYGEGGTHVAHPGPAGFYAMVPGLRMVGPIWGALGSMAIVAGVCLVTTAWVAFRRAGPAAGLGAAVLCAAAAFSIGAGGLLDPLSSNAGRLPLLASAALVWALIDGDLRLAPLAAAVWSYGAQQHLSILPAAVLVLAAGGAACLYWLWRPDPDLVGSRKRAGLWVGGAALVGLLAWSPVLVQQITSDPGNISALISYTGDGERENLGKSRAMDQVSHVLGPRPFLGRSAPEGWDLTFGGAKTQSVLVLVVNAALLAAIVVWTCRRPVMPQVHRRTLWSAVGMIGVLVLAGLVTGANVPDSIEQGRLNFYHWAFALSFFQLTVFGWAAALAVLAARNKWFANEAASSTEKAESMALAEPARLHVGGVPRMMAGGSVIVLCLVIAGVPWIADRPSDRLVQAIGTVGVRDFTEEVANSPELADGEGSVVVLNTNSEAFVQLADTVAVRLRATGTDARLPPHSIGFVHPDHLLDACDADRVLVISRWWPGDEDPPGKLIVDVDAAPDLDMDVLDRLVASAEGQEVDLGEDLLGTFTESPEYLSALLASSMSYNLHLKPRSVFTNRSSLDVLIAHPPAAPTLDIDDLRTVRSALEPGALTLGAKRFRAYLLNPEEYTSWRAVGAFPCAPR